MNTYLKLYRQLYIKAKREILNEIIIRDLNIEFNTVTYTPDLGK